MADNHERNLCTSRPQLTREESNDMTGAYKATTQQGGGDASPISDDVIRAFMMMQPAEGATVSQITEQLKLWRDMLTADRLSHSSPEICAKCCEGLRRAAGVVAPVLEPELDQYRQYFAAWRINGVVQGETHDSKQLAEAAFLEKSNSPAGSNQQGSAPVLLMDDSGSELRFSGADRRHVNELKKWCLSARTGTGNAAPAIQFGTMRIALPPGAFPGMPFQVQTPAGTTMQMVVPGQIPPGGAYDVQYPIPQPPPPGKEACLLATKLLCGILSALDEIRRHSLWNSRAFPPAAQAVCRLHSHVCARCNVRHAKQAYLFAKQVGVSDLPELDAVTQTLNQVLELPKWWDLSIMQGLSMEDATTFKVELNDKFNLYGSIELNPHDLERLQALFDGSFRKKYTRDRRGGTVPSRLTVERAVRIQNAQNWAEYTGRQEEIRADLKGLKEKGTSLLDRVHELKTQVPKFKEFAGAELDSETNSAWLFHGTTAGEAIAKSDFRIDKAGSNVGTMFGRGIYLAESCTKSDEYSQEDPQGLRQMLLCRAILGNILYCDEKDPNKDDCVRQCTMQPAIFHSVLGDREKVHGTFREFIVYDEDQVYPEFVVWYKRHYDS